MIQPLSAARIQPNVGSGRAVASKGTFALPFAVEDQAREVAPHQEPTADADDDRQDDASTGKDLPDTDTTVDPRFLWMQLAAPPIDQPKPIGLPDTPTTPGAGTASAGPEKLGAATEATFALATLPPVTAPVIGVPTTPSAAPATTPAMPSAPTMPALNAALASGGATNVPALDGTPTSPIALVPPMIQAAAAPASVAPTGPRADTDPTAGNGIAATTDAPKPSTADLSLAPGPIPVAMADPGKPAAATPALQAFAGAMRMGSKPDDKSEVRGDKDLLASASPVASGQTDMVRHAVTAAGATQDQTLDMRRDHWPSSMIDHIESLRDAADATSTRIRVVPDALGTIDLSVKRDGDTLHVHFAAEQAATRTMLTDAQPRLAQIAESRGLRLGDTGVGGQSAGGSGAGAGADTSGQQQRTPVRPIPASTTPRALRATDADTRIA